MPEKDLKEIRESSYLSDLSGRGDGTRKTKSHTDNLGVTNDDGGSHYVGPDGQVYASRKDFLDSIRS
jgi:hypothetical protein